MYTIAIIGRPNVGKSSIFNMLLKKRMAITHEQAGVTRDIKKASVIHQGVQYTFLDTGGITDEGVLSDSISQKSYAAIENAHALLLVVSIEEITAEDEEIIAFARTLTIPIVFVVNKVDNEQREWMSSEYYKFGIGDPICVSAVHRYNVDVLWNKICEILNIDNTHEVLASHEEVTNNDELTRLLILGKPNTGKSSLLNAFLGEERTLVSNIPGTTRDIIEEEVVLYGTRFTLIDSAGIRRKNRIDNDIEYFSSHRAISAISSSDIVLLIIDVMEGMTEQDKKIAALILKEGKGFVICLNKWDLIKDKKSRLQEEKYRMTFLVPQLQYVPVCPISALEKTGLKEVVSNISLVSKQLLHQVATSVLNRKLEEWTTQVQPPLVRRKRGKVKFMYQVSTKPVVFQAKVNNPSLFNEAYKQYLINKIKTQFGFNNIPIQLYLTPNNT